MLCLTVIIGISDSNMTVWKEPNVGTHSECVRLTAFPLQQWLHKHASVLHYMYIACLGLPNCLMQGEKYAILHAVCDVAE